MFSNATIAVAEVIVIVAVAVVALNLFIILFNAWKVFDTESVLL